MILEDFAEDAAVNPKFTDKSSVTVSGIITDKRTKITKNGTTMAFIKLEDRYAEIEVIVFAKQYSRFADDIFVDNAVSISGNISYEEGEEPRILLSSLTALVPNSAFECAEIKTTPAPSAKPEEVKPQVFYIKVASLDDQRINSIQRLSALYRGNAEIVLFDETTRKYSKLKGVTVAPTEKVLEKLTSYFGDGAVVLK